MNYKVKTNVLGTDLEALLNETCRDGWDVFEIFASAHGNLFTVVFYQFPSCNECDGEPKL